MATAPSRFVPRLVEYADQADTPAEFVIPEDLSVLSDEDLTALHDQAVGHFDALYNGGANLSDDDLAALAVLTEGIEALLAETETRRTQAAARASQAAELASRVHLSVETDDGPVTPATDENGDPVTDADGNEVDENGDPIVPSDPEAPPNPDGSAASVQAAASRREIRVSLPALSRRQVIPPPAHQAQRMQDVVLAAAEVGGFVAGQGMDWPDIGRMIDRRLTSFNHSQYSAAQRGGQHMRQQFGVVTIRKPFDPELVVQNNDPGHVDEVLQRARNESRLPGNSLVAAGGWCAPSETIYDLCEMESRDGLVSVPEIGIARGGISWTTGPDFATIYNNTGFCYTEQDVIDGDFDGNGGGSKPCYTVPCPSFTEARMGVCGLCINAGLLQQRGYPEVIARTVRGALVAHDHKMSANVISAIVAGSTAVTATAAQVGATAPILDTIEQQVEHIRYTQRMSRGATMEAVFPYWVRGAIRSDLARRQGIDLLNVSDAQIDGWFRARGINPQYVYDWQPLDTTAVGTFKAWPATVQFLLYPAGTWVKGGADVITLDTIYDSVLLGQNEFTALFTEEGYLMAKLCHDSRVVTVAICPDGATHMGVDIACDGTKAVTTP